MDDYQPRNLNALEKAVNDTAGKVSLLWTSFILLGVYLAITTASVTHRDLLMNTPIRMPVLGVDLPANGYFAVAPIVYSVFHAYLSLQLLLLARKVAAFQQVLSDVAPLEADRRYARQRLDSFPFLQWIIGERRPAGALLAAICAISLAIAPLLVLLHLLLAYLPSHDGALTWLHRSAVMVDLLLTWWLWRHIDRVTPKARPVSFALAVSASLAIVTFLFALAAFPGEPLYRNVATRGIDTIWTKALKDSPPLSHILFEGDFDAAAGRSGSLFSNRLVLPDGRFFEGGKPVSLRGRDLRGAVFRRADLRKADFSGADLTDASFEEARLQGAKFTCIWLESLEHDDGAAKPERCGRLVSARFDRADLRGVGFSNADMRGARFENAQLQGASFLNNDLTAADFRGAQMAAVVLHGQELTGTSFESAILWGAELGASNLRGASLSFAQAQGANLGNATLDGAVIEHAHLYRTRLPLDFAEALFVGAHLDPYAYPELKPNEPIQTLSLRSRADYAKLVAEVTEGFEDPASAERVARRLIDLHPAAMPSLYQAVQATKSAPVDTPAPDVARLMERQEAVIRETLCGLVSSPAVVHGLVGNKRVVVLMREPGFDLDGFMTSPACRATAAWTPIDRRRLEGLRDNEANYVSPARPRRP